MCASHYQLGNLTAVVDRNHLQQGATTEETSSLDPLAGKAAAFGFDVLEIDAHDFDQILDAFAKTPTGSPRMIIAHSHKGYPISFMIDQVGWHHRVPDEKQIDGILAELEVAT